MKRIKCLMIIILIMFLSVTETKAQSCTISAQQFVRLTNATIDEKELMLMPCFDRESDNKYRRDYGQKGNGYQYYDIINFKASDDEACGEQVSLYTTNVSRYLKYKNALKAYGFRLDKKSSVVLYRFGSYRMQSGSSKNADDDPSYWILIYKYDCE